MLQICGIMMVIAGIFYIWGTRKKNYKIAYRAALAFVALAIAGYALCFIEGDKSILIFGSNAVCIITWIWLAYRAKKRID